MLCEQCRFDNPAGMRFCGQCGSRLGAGSAAVTPVAEPGRDVVDAERRHVTIMFIDVVNYTTLSERLDPEVLREIMLRYQTCSAAAIQRYEGHTAKYLGDGELVYFGYPTAHEDDALRAVLAAMDIIKEVTQLAPEFKRAFDIDFVVRIGIDSGMVIAGQMGVAASRERLAVVGGPPNIAARLQALAEPNTILVSANTHRLVQARIATTSLGQHVLKGVSDIMEVFRVEHGQDVHSRSRLIVEQQQTPLVDRNDELQLLLEHWSSAKQHHGRAVMMVGDPGIGKSRLTSALISHISGQECECLLGYASPYRRNSALSPIVELLKTQFAFADDDSATDRMRKVERETDRLDFDRERTVPLLASLLSLPLPSRYAPLGLEPPTFRRELLGLLTRWFQRISDQTPLLFIMEDLHWTDPSTLELLAQLVEHCTSSPLLLLFTTRNDYQGSLKTHEGVTVIPLGPLAADDSMALIAAVSQKVSLPESVTSNIATKTDGIPLYIEEVTRMVMASDRVAIPESIHDSLTARLDMLSDAKEIAQTGAVIGRDFSLDLIAAVSPLSTDTLRQGLQKLVDSDLVHVKRSKGQVTYTFKHALIQDAAYESMLKAKRRAIHERVARVLEGERYEELRTTQPEALAHHYTEAGIHKSAIQYWHAAGMRSWSRSAGLEAISHLQKALEVVALLEAGPDRDVLELDMLLSLGGPMTAVRGYATDDVERIYLRAHVLAESVGDPTKLYRCLFGFHVTYVARGQYDRAQETVQALMRLASRSPEEHAYLLEAERAAGTILFLRGRHHESIEHLDNAIRIYDPARHSDHLLQFASDPRVSCLLWSQGALWLLGHRDQATQRSDRAVQLATELNHALTLSFAATWAAQLRVFSRDWTGARQSAENAIRICSERGINYWLNVSRVFHGRALMKCGNPDEGLVTLRRGLTGYRRTGAQVGLPMLLSQLAESLLELGQIAEGQATIDEAIELARRNDERFWEPELRRLRGDLMRAGKAGEDAVLDEYRAAASIARSQDAKSLELRALVSLLQLRNDADDRVRLQTLYDGFGDQQNSDLLRARPLLQ